MTGLLTLNEARMKYVDFTVPLFMERIHVAVKRPVLGPDVAGFVKPLTVFVRVRVCVIPSSVLKHRKINPMNATSPPIEFDGRHVNITPTLYYSMIYLRCQLGIY